MKSIFLTVKITPNPSGAVVRQIQAEINKTRKPAQISKNLAAVQYRDRKTFSHLIAVFKYPGTNRKICTRRFDNNNIATLKGYKGHPYTLWGYLPNGKRKKIPLGIGVFQADEHGRIVWHKNTI